MKRLIQKRLLMFSVLSICTVFPMHTLHAQKNTLQLRETIQGNQEQPTVLYIVPWRAVEAPPASYQPLANLVKENFRLIDRDEFRRSLKVSLRAPSSAAISIE